MSVAKRRQGGEKFLKNYAKVIWHVYPFLKAVVKDYEEHIRNKAVLSFESRTTAERLAEYIAGEIIVKERLQALKWKLDGVVDTLDETEKKLLAIRYFGKRKLLCEFLKNDGGVAWSERKYFRRQNKLCEKLGEALTGVGLTEEVYLREFAHLHIFKKIAEFLKDGKDERLYLKEKEGFSAATVD